jgi:hypothetical protein
MIDAEDQNALQIQIVPQLLHAGTKNVLILVIVHKMQIVHQEIIEEYVYVVLVLPEILME